MVFLIQNTQNRDGAAVRLKLDELIRAVQGAQNWVMSLEDMSEEELERLRALYYQLAERAQASLKQGSQKKEAPQVRKDGS
jgi:low affinity Fe/Cu permease